jgi:hypothetical protein
LKERNVVYEKFREWPDRLVIPREGVERFVDDNPEMAKDRERVIL